MSIFIIVIFILLVVAVLILQVLGQSATYRAKHYYHLSPRDVEQLVSQRSQCWFTTSTTTLSKGKSATLWIDKDDLHLNVENGQEEVIKLTQIKTTTWCGLGWLFVSPQNQTQEIIGDSEKWNFFFGNSQLDKTFNNKFYPLPWITLPQEVAQADKTALAFMIKIRQTQTL